MSEDANAQPRPRLNQSRGKKPYGIVGTCPEGNIQAVKTKRVSVFATKFLPDLDAETLTNYLKEKLHHDVICQKMDTAQNRYSSFKVTVECDKVEDVYEPQIWPHGVFVRRFFEPRKPRANAGPVDVVTTSSLRRMSASEALASTALKS